MARLVLSDASPLIALSRVNGLAWLPRLFGTVTMPPEVYREVLPGLDLPGEDAITQALSAGWLDIAGPGPGIPAVPEGTSRRLISRLVSRTQAFATPESGIGQ